MNQVDIINAIKALNKEHIGWNIYENHDGPQPNLWGGPLTYKHEAFWKETVSIETVKELVRLIMIGKSNFCIEFDERSSKFTLYDLPDFMLNFKTLVLKVHKKQLCNEGYKLLMELVSNKRNQEDIAMYQDASIETPPDLYGPDFKYEDGKKVLVEFGNKHLVGTEQVTVPPYYH